MDLKNINSFLILFISLFILSCQTIDNFRSNEVTALPTENDVIENIETINKCYEFKYTICLEFLMLLISV